VGVGRIGSRVAQAAEALGLRVLRNDPPLARATGDPAFLPLDELMGADILTLHVPLTKDGPDPTFHLFDRGRLGRLKPGAILLNSSRGAVVESGALSAALRTGRLRGAAIDVWEDEPRLDFDLLERVTIGTAHVAGYSIEGKLDAVRIVRDEVRAHFWVGCPWEPAEDSAHSAPEEIEAPPADLPDQEALRRIVRSAYDIGLDDALLRGLSRLPAGERAEAFRRLRSGYRVRHEFPGWTVCICPDRAGLTGLVEAVGFQTVPKGGTAENRSFSALKERT
jgi:erythronate-4-phosphate dehydrogenase